jgi:hypothetical protein
VIAYAKGGALETVIADSTGLFFNEQTEESLIDAVEKAARISWDDSIIRENALRFGHANFISGIADSAERLLGPDAS